MKILVTGIAGQLGQDLADELNERGHEVAGFDRVPEPPVACQYRQVDLTDRAAVLAAMEEVRPEAVIHCAAWTAVALAEEPENRAAVFAVNADATRWIAEGCRAVGAKMLYISTDYVFNGQGTEPWKPDQKDYAPLSVYGESKLQGERAVAGLLERFFVVRIAWLFGPRGKNFVQTMLRVGKTHESVRVVCDQIGTPTYCPDLSRLLADMIVTDRYGYYHATNEGGFISWYEFTKEIYRQAGMKTEVVPVTTAEYGLSRAARPFNSRLDKSKLAENGFALLPTWQDALSRYLTAIGEKQ